MAVNKREHHPCVVGISGASGAPYAQRLLRFFVEQKLPAHLVITEAGRQVIRHEAGVDLGKNSFSLKQGLNRFIGKNYDRWITYHETHNWHSPLASGSFKSGPMVVVPCSAHTLAAVANSHGSNLLERRADIMLKEKQKLILVFRETPLHSTHLEHLLKLSRMGAHILPAMPGFYHQPKTLQDMIDFMVGRILDHLEISNALFRRWGEK